MRGKYNIYNTDGSICTPGFPFRTTRMASERAKQFIWDNIDGDRIIEILKEVEPNCFEFAWSHYREVQDDGHSKWTRSKKTVSEIVESGRKMV